MAILASSFESAFIVHEQACIGIVRETHHPHREPFTSAPIKIRSMTVIRSAFLDKPFPETEVSLRVIQHLITRRAGYNLVIAEVSQEPHPVDSRGIPAIGTNSGGFEITPSGTVRKFSQFVILARRGFQLVGHHRHSQLLEDSVLGKINVSAASNLQNNECRNPLGRDEKTVAT